MAEPTKKSPAAAKRKEADTKQQERIANLQKTSAQLEASNKLEQQILARRQSNTPKVEVTEAEAAPFVPTTHKNEKAHTPKPKAEKPAKEKKERKPREAKPKAEVPAVSDLVAKIEEKVAKKLNKEHAKALNDLKKAHTAEIKGLKAGHKVVLKKESVSFNTELKRRVEESEKKAYEAGFKAGEKAANKAIAAALKGR